MRYYLDCEFDGFGGALMSMAVVPQDYVEGRECLYAVMAGADDAADPWVREHVVPLLDQVPWRAWAPAASRGPRATPQDLSAMLERWLRRDPDPWFITDWPDDLRYLMAALITGPGEMVRSGRQISFEVVRVDAYPTRLEGAVQHNAWWDAMALRELMEPGLAIRR